MQFADMTWMDVEHYLEHHDDRVVVVTGACEQHAYLSLLTDIRTPLAIAQAAAQVEHVLIAPPLNIGVSPYFSAYPGTISLRPETFATLVREVIGDLLAGGFRRVLVSNGHGGNTGILSPLLIELAGEHPDAAFGLYEWWKHDQVRRIAEKAGLPPNHANWLEALPACRVGDLPAGDKDPVDLPAVTSPEQFRQVLGDGSFGGPYDAPAEVYDTLFAAAVEAMVEALKAL